MLAKPGHHIPDEHVIALLKETESKFTLIRDTVMDAIKDGELNGRSRVSYCYDLQFSAKCVLCEYLNMDCERCPLSGLPRALHKFKCTLSADTTGLYCMNNSMHKVFLASGITLSTVSTSVSSTSVSMHELNLEWLDWFIFEVKKLIAKLKKEVPGKTNKIC